MEEDMVGALVFACVAFLIVPSYAQNDHQYMKYGCDGKIMNLDCPRMYMLEILSANYGRTNRKICRPHGKPFNETNCISRAAKTIIERRCNNKRHCSILASSSELGDPCPSVPKYIDVIYKCVKDKERFGVTRRPLYTAPTFKTLKTMQQTKEPITTPTPFVLPTVQKGGNPNTTIEGPKESRRDGDQGFFRSLLLLLVLAKDKPKHSLLSVLAGIAAGTVIILMTVIICLCLERKRKKGEGETFGDSGTKKPGDEELQELNEVDGKNERNSDSAQSARSDDHVDSAFGDDETRECNDYEVAEDDVAFLDAYINKHNPDRSLPRPPLPAKARDVNAQRMSRRAHNDGSKGRNYDYNSNNEHSFTTFS